MDKVNNLVIGESNLPFRLSDQVLLNTLIPTDVPDRLATVSVESEIIPWEKAKDFFFGNQEIEEIHIPDSDCLQAWDLDGKACMNGTENRIPLRYDSLEKADYYMQLFSTNPDNLLYDQSQKYKENGDLSFCTKAEAIERAKALLHELGVDNVEYRTIYCLDYKSLEEEEKELIRKREEDPLPEDMPQDHFKVDWSEEDDLYCIQFQVNVQGIPVMYDVHQVQTPIETSLVESQVEVWLTRDGIQAFEYMENYRVKAVKEEKKLISAEEILRMLVDRFELVISEEDYIIQTFELVWLPVWEEASQELVLYPIWNVNVDTKVVDSKTGTVKDVTEHLWLNAYDGVEMHRNE